MDVLRYSPTRFPAEVARTRTIGEFVLTETRYRDHAALPTHAHEYACLVYVLGGTFHERSGRRDRAGAPGMMIVRPEGEPHSNRFERGGGRCLNVELPPHWMASRAIESAGAFTGGAFAVAGHRLHEELVHADDVSALAVESLILELFANAIREQRRETAAPPRWLVDVKERLHDDPAARLTLEELAITAGVHPVHLATTFRRVFGHPVASYVRQLRIEYACRALTTSNVPLAEIALAAGFADQSHFGRTFKRLMKMTPAQYRTRSSA